MTIDDPFHPFRKPPPKWLVAPVPASHVPSPLAPVALPGIEIVIEPVPAPIAAAKSPGAPAADTALRLAGDAKTGRPWKTPHWE